MRGGGGGSLGECVSPVRIRYGAVVGVLLSNRSAGDILYAGAWASLAEASRAGVWGEVQQWMEDTSHRRQLFASGDEGA